MDLPAELTALTGVQDGLLHHRQVTAAGLSRASLRWRVRRGLWRLVLPLVYATFTGALSSRQRMVAAMLYAGPDSQVTGAAALTVYGMRYAPVGSTIPVLVPHTRQIAAAQWVRPHRTRRLDTEPRNINGLVLASVPRAVLDAARGCRSERPVHALICEAVHRRFCTLEHLRAELDAGPRQYSAIARRVLTEQEAGSRSAPGAEARAVLAGSQILPPLVWNPSLRTADGQHLPSPDGWIPEVDLGVEIDPQDHHAPRDGWERTMRRHTELAMHGASVLRFTPAQLRADPDGVRHTVERAYLDRLVRGIRSTLTIAQA